MKAKIKTLNIGSMSKTAIVTGKFNGKEIEFGLSNRNSSWYDYCDKFKKVGDDFEIDDSEIKYNAETARYFVNRIKADTAMDIAKMQKAMAIVKSASTVVED